MNYAQILTRQHGAIMYYEDDLARGVRMIKRGDGILIAVLTMQLLTELPRRELVRRLGNIGEFPWGSLAPKVKI